ncbi:DUF4062 domain-containing protein [Ruegeria sp. HKCCD6157]|uniref:DUF4062 domain-containing protein n=1 Tax=Ruegeria sp. HKCCD6157 TaxID=2690707 RepID=UPI001492754C|nr:DUF4062 domain-containing protein [Ruegeria sp. HKCCD6157]NOE27305.1 DUF4062 domain-containing protein [Ruegeria sp. HKCCD6157]
MSKKKYQVFLSSTYSDLQTVRDSITRALYEMDCIPVGMEAFPAADEEQFEFIKKLIDQTDYYVLVIGARYGSIAPDGMSYTEKEYRYALEIGVPVLAFVHSSPDTLPKEVSDISDPIKAEGFYRFRNDVTAARMVKMWENDQTLPASVVLALNRAFATAPRQGWVRSPSVDNEKTLEKLVELQEELASAREELKLFKAVERQLEDIAGLDTEVTCCVEAWKRDQNSSVVRDGVKEFCVKLEDVFRDVGPNMIESLNQDHFSNMVALFASKGQRKWNSVDHKFSLTRETLNAFRIQLEALGLIKVFRSKTVGGDIANFWQLTDAGSAEVRRLNVIKAK